MSLTSPNAGGASTTCVALTKAGTACRMPPLGGSTRCWAHADDSATESRRQEARVAGGASRGLQLTEVTPEQFDELPSWWQLKTARDTREAYVWLAQRLAQRSIDARTGNAMAAVLNGLVAATREHELHLRLDALERATGKRR